MAPAWIGDMVMAQSLLITIKNLNPGAQIDVLEPAWTFPLLARMPEVYQSVLMTLRCFVAFGLAVGVCLPTHFAEVAKAKLAEFINLLSWDDVAVSNDSGSMHVAALNKPLVAIYGSSDPEFTPPLHQAASIVSLQKPCAPCFKREYPLGHTQCLTEITPDRALSEIMTFNL